MSSTLQLVIGLIVVANLLFFVNIALPKLPCVKCGKNCAGRIAGGGPDSPRCVDCVKQDMDLREARNRGMI